MSASAVHSLWTTAATAAEPISKIDAPKIEYAQLSPTLIVDTKASDTINQEEVFGPVVSVIPCRSLEEAVDIGNGVEYGLSASIYTRDINRAFRAKIGIFLLAFVALVVIGRAVLPSELRGYVNRTLDRNLLYEGRIGRIELHLWRGAYSIDDTVCVRECVCSTAPTSGLSA